MFNGALGGGEVVHNAIVQNALSYLLSLLFLSTVARLRFFQLLIAQLQLPLQFNYLFLQIFLHLLHLFTRVLLYLTAHLLGILHEGNIIFAVLLLQGGLCDICQVAIDLMDELLYGNLIVGFAPLELDGLRKHS